MTNPADVISRLYTDFSDNKTYLESNTQISLLMDYKDHISKILLLCIASYFEDEVKALIHRCLRTDSNIKVRSFINNKAISRQYHTFFSWDKSNANSFFGLFGDDFKKEMEIVIKNDEALNQSIKDFLFLGNKRNEMVHENYAIFSLENTTEELYLKYQSAQYFLQKLEEVLAK